MRISIRIPQGGRLCGNLSDFKLHACWIDWIGTLKHWDLEPLELGTLELWYTWHPIILVPWYLGSAMPCYPCALKKLVL